METIYIITEGCYSDYSIRGVFDDKELAMRFIDTFGGEIEKWELNPHEKQLKAGYSPYFIRMAKDGTVINIRPTTSSYGFGDSESGFDIHKNLFVHILARDEAHAIKITNERRTILIATEQWPE